MSTSSAPAPSPLRAALDALIEGTGGNPSDDDVFATFMEWCSGAGIEPYPHQEEAALEVASSANVVLATPTGSGKSLVAVGAHFAAAATGRRSVYTAPIKALVSEKFFALCELFGADMVGMATGDAAVNSDAPIICCTAEVLANQALREGSAADVGLVVMDEFHYYGEPDRGWAWQVPLLEMPKAQFLLMSATLGDSTSLREDLTRRTGRETALIDDAERPVPLSFWYATTPLLETLTEVLETHGAPVYVVHFTQTQAVERAQTLMSVNMCSKGEKAAIADAIGAFRFGTGFGKTLSRLVRHGIGVHHAGMLPKYRRLVEQLAQQGLLKVICGTDTLGVGINVPIRTVLYTGLTKYDGRRMRQLSAREFHQIAGRAGRAGFDTAGTVIAQAPEHEVENLKQYKKAEGDNKKLKKLRKKKAPDGFVNWTETSFNKLIEADPEPLTPRLAMSHGIILNVLQRPDDPAHALGKLLRENHIPRKQQNRLIVSALRAARALKTAGVIEKLDEPDGFGRTYRLTTDVPLNFALNQALSPFALAALELLDPESDDYALDVVSVYEATLDDPRAVLFAQEKKARAQAVAEMKADGIEYEERMELLEEVSWPKPLAQELDAAYETYASASPWVRDHELSPKTVVRDMWERAMTFTEYVSYYALTRSEGVLLRYLADAYRTLRSSVPTDACTPEFETIRDWLGELVRQTDSSLLDEWEGLVSGEGDDAPAVRPAEQGPRTLTSNERAFTAMVRNAMFRRVELLAREDYDELAELSSGTGWHADAWADAIDPYFEEYGEILTCADARSPRQIQISDDPDGARVWQIRQVLTDPDGDNDWAITATCDLDASDEAGAPVLAVTGVGPHGV